MRVLIVAEGEHELGGADGESALETLTRRLMRHDAEFERRTVRDHAVRVHLQPGKSDGYEKRALGWVRFAEREGFDALVLVVDQDDDLRRRRQLEKAQEHTAFGVPRALGVAIRTFDARMLADEKALANVLSCRIQRQPDPESIPDPKGICTQLREGSPRASISTAEFYAQVAAETDLQAIEARCPKGFRPFAARLRAL
jgi:hypothetical protein